MRRARPGRVLSVDAGAAFGTALAELDRSGRHLSGYLRGRFGDGAGVLWDGQVRGPAVPVEPPGFRDLTFRQASAIVAAFEEYSARDVVGSP